MANTSGVSKLITLYSEVQSERVRWFWYPFIAYGKVTLMFIVK